MNKTLPILTEGDTRLTEIAAPVNFPDLDLAEQLSALHATLDDFRKINGFGRAIAAPQLGICKRIIALNLGATPFAVINPQISWRSEDIVEVWDDCLSVPEHIVRVRRHRSISLYYSDEQGRVRHWQHLPLDLAELLQHEIDHLDGVLMTHRAVHHRQNDGIRPMTDYGELVSNQRPQHRLSLQHITDSIALIPPEFLNSPQYQCESLNGRLGCKITLKLDYTNPIRSFKGRGASYFINTLLQQKSVPQLICASAGNWGQALAYICRANALSLVIYASVNANPLKVARMRALGAEVRLQGEDFDSAKHAAKTYADSIGGLMIEDGYEARISEGHGTLAMELLSRGDAYDAVLIPLGNGALLTGVGRWFKATSPDTQIIGVSAANAPAMEQSWRCSKIIDTATADTIADGVAVRQPIEVAVQDMQGLVDEVLLVEESDITAAVNIAYQEAGLILEPSAALPIAAIDSSKKRFRGQHIASILTGSNIPADKFKELLQD